MSIVTYNNRSIANMSAIPGAAKSLTHIKTLTASSSSTLSFVNGSSDVVLDSTYPIYLFKFINIHQSQTSFASFNVGFRDGGSNYDASKTTTKFEVYHTEADGTLDGLISPNLVASLADNEAVTVNKPSFTVYLESDEIMYSTDASGFYSISFDVREVIT